jgi:hypothetical protein
MDINIRYGLFRCSGAFTPPDPISAFAGILQAAMAQSANEKTHEASFKSQSLMHEYTGGPFGR